MHLLNTPGTKSSRFNFVNVTATSSGIPNTWFSDGSCKGRYVVSCPSKIIMCLYGLFL